MDPDLLLYPRRQPYFKVCCLAMRLMGIWPEREMRFAKAGRTAWLLYYLYCVAAMLHYALHHLHEDFFQVCHLFASCLLAAFTLPHILVPLIHKETYGILFDEFYEKIHLANHAHDEYTMKMLLSRERVTAIAVKVLTGGVLIGATLYGLVPIANNIRSGAYTADHVKLESVLCLTVPFDIEHDVLGWAALAIFSAPLLYAMPLVGVYTAIMFFSFILHLDGHIDLLKRNLSRISERFASEGERGQASETAEKEVAIRFVDAVKHHCLILRFRSLVQTVYGELLLSIYIFNMVGYCLILLQLTRGLSDGALRYGIIAIVLFCQMSFFTLALDTLSHKLEDLTRTLYMTPWTTMSRRNKQMLRFMLLMSQKSCRFTAANMLDVSAPMMLSVLKTSLSYFAFLQSVDNKN